MEQEEVNMCNFWSALATRSGKVIWYDSIWSHEKQIELAGFKDDKLVDRDFVRVEISTEKNIYSYKPKISDFKFKVDEEDTLPNWFDEEKAEKACWKEFKKAYKTDRMFNRDDIREFVESVKNLKRPKPDGRPKKEWKVFYGKTWNAARDVAWKAAGIAARNAAGIAAGIAAGNAARIATRDAAWKAAGIAARNAAWDAARNAAWNAARDAAGDAALIAEEMIVADLDYPDKKKHEEHAEKRMEVWKKGYGLYCDVNGKLYVYVKRRPE